MDWSSEKIAADSESPKLGITESFSVIPRAARDSLISSIDLVPKLRMSSQVGLRVSNQLADGQDAAATQRV